MALSLVSVDPKAAPRQRRFDQQVRDLLNDLIRNGDLIFTSSGWAVAPNADAGSVILDRSFNFTPRYGTWG